MREAKKQLTVMRAPYLYQENRSKLKSRLISLREDQYIHQ